MGLGDRFCPDFNKEIRPGPLELGFDECFIEPGNLHFHVYIENHHVLGASPDDPFSWDFEPNPNRPKLKGGAKARTAKKPGCTGVFAEKAVSFIDAHKDDPFLLYLATNNVHTAIIPGEEFTGKSGCGPYGDYIMELDWMVGQVLEALDRNGLEENTLVLFSSDNGGGYYKPHNAEAFARGHRINGELLGQKADVWEGGHRVPFIVRWPERVKPGMRSDALVCLTDVMTTMADIFGIPLPEDAGPDSFSFLPALTGEKSSEAVRTTLVSQGHHKGLLAVRQGPWVLIPAQGSDGNTLTGAWNMMTFSELGFVHSDYTSEGELQPDAPPGQLYDLSADISQTTNLYRENPAKVEELTELLDRIKRDGKSGP
jgi:arylsulfatase A-like enzyme